MKAPGRKGKYAAAFLVAALIAMTNLAGTAAQQGNLQKDIPPPHSGTAAGQASPEPRNPPPPVTNGTNSVVTEPAHPTFQTFTGVVSDSYCTFHHYMLSHATPAECTRYCIAHKGTYVLLVGDKVYSLRDRPGHILDGLAGKNAQVTGALMEGDIIEIKSVRSGH